jgi:hypothetical protein
VDDALCGILLEDIYFAFDVTGRVTPDQVAAVALSGSFRQEALLTGPGVPPGSLTVALLVPALRVLGIYCEGEA